MGLFSRKSSESDGSGRRPSEEEVHAAGRALQQGGGSELADRLATEAGEHRQETAMRILGAAAEYEPTD